MVSSEKETGVPNNKFDNYLQIARLDHAVLIRVRGLGNQLLAPVMQSFVESEIKIGFRHFVVDLQECSGLDSTFMGTFIGLACTVRDRDGWFCLINVSEENRRLLKMLGVLHVVPIRSAYPVEDVATTNLYIMDNPSLRIKQIHSAHKSLIEIDAQNKERFSAFLAAMEAELNSIPIIKTPGSGNHCISG